MSQGKKTREYQYLKRRIRELERHFDFNQSINGITKLQSDRLRGLRLLCHAEFEDYFESIALKLLERGVKKWERRQVANYNLASLLIEHNRIEINGSIETKLYKIVADYRNIVKNNHGIKGDNIKKLYQPLGYRTEDFDALFLSTLESYGKERGEIAHMSIKHTQQLLDKNDEYNKIEEILMGIVDFEQVIKSVQ